MGTETGPQGQAGFTMPLVGIGTDVHAFERGRQLWCAGLHWEGRSSGSPGTPTGTWPRTRRATRSSRPCGLGDLGAHFGTSRPEWAGASGVALLGEAARIVRAEGFQVGNVAVQVVGLRPKVGKRRDEAVAALSGAVGAPVSVSGTTTDGLGLTGRGEGLAAIATALVYRVG